MTEEDRAEFERGQADGSQAMRKFFDPYYISCTGWIAHVAATKFGFDTSGLKELMYWADIVDGAKYESAAAAVGDGRAGDEADDGVGGVCGRCADPKGDSAADGEDARGGGGAGLCAGGDGAFDGSAPAGDGVDRGAGGSGAGSDRFDLTDETMEGYSKFIPYYLHPEGTYVVGLSRVGGG